MLELCKKNEILTSELKEIRSEIRSLKFMVANLKKSNGDLPVQLPLDSLDDLQLLNEKLQNPETFQEMLTFMKGVGGISFADCTYKLMATLFTNKLANSINWRGVNNRTSIAGSSLTTLVVTAVMARNYPESSHAKVKEKMQRWIQRARRRHPDFVGNEKPDASLTNLQEDSYDDDYLPSTDV